MSARAMTLYSIEDDLVFCLDTLEGLPDDESCLRTELEEQIARLIATEMEKVDGVARMLVHFKSQAELAAAEIKRLQARKKSFEAAHERLEASAKLAIDCSGRKRLEGETATLCLQKNPRSVFISDFNEVPAAYKIVKTEISIDKDMVKRAIKSGVVVPGA